MKPCPTWTVYLSGNQRIPNQGSSSIFPGTEIDSVVLHCLLRLQMQHRFCYQSNHPMYSSSGFTFPLQTCNIHDTDLSYCPCCSTIVIVLLLEASIHIALIAWTSSDSVKPISNSLHGHCDPSRLLEKEYSLYYLIILYRFHCKTVFWKCSLEKPFWKCFAQYSWLLISWCSWQQNELM